MSGLLADDVKPGTSLFSSLLPLGRADFGPSVFSGGQKLDFSSDSGFLYFLDTTSTTGPSAKPVRIVAAAGAAKLRVIPKAGNSAFYPYLQQQAAATAPSGSNSGFYAGNDWLTLLDACAQGDGLAVDIFSLHPVETILDPGESLFIPPVDFSFGGALNKTQACKQPYNPTTPLFSVPLKKCPSSLIKLGRARRQSMLLELDSPFRISLAQAALKTLSLEELRLMQLLNENPSLQPTPQQVALGNKVIRYVVSSIQRISTDIDARTKVYRSLLIAPDSLKSSIDPLSYYELCAPKTCTWMETSRPTLLGGDGSDSTLFFSLDKLGAGAGAAMIVVYAIYLLFYIIGRALLFQSRARVKQEEGEPASASAGEGAGVARLSEEVTALRAALAQLKRQVERTEAQPQAPGAGPAAPSAQQGAAALTLRAEPPPSAAPLAGPAAAAPAAGAGGAEALHPGRVRLELPSAPSARPSATALEVAALVWRGGAGELPPHWDHKADSRGEVYFITPDSQSTWDDPRVDWLTCASLARRRALPQAPLPRWKRSPP